MAAAAAYSRGRDFISSSKVNSFHHILKQITGYLLHPSIQNTSSRYRIADLGTQTAVWPMDIAASSPDTIEVDAFDISDKFWPPQQWLPANVRLHHHDVYEVFPEQLIGQFDVVHIRLFLTLGQDKISRILENAMLLLKPGGYVQWVEHDKTGLEIVTASPVKEPDAVATANAVEAMIEMNKNPFPNYDYRWVERIGPTMTTVGFESIEEHSIVPPKSLLTQLNDLHLMALLDVPEGLSATIDKFKVDHMEALGACNSKGVAMLDTFRCVIGQKPDN